MKNRIVYHILAVIVFLYWSFENFLIYFYLKYPVGNEILINTIVYLGVIIWLLIEGYRKEKKK